jgi:hypothetical protein
MMCLASDNEISCIQTTTHCKLTEVVEALETRAIECSIYFIHLIEFIILCLLYLFYLEVLDNGGWVRCDPILEVFDVIGVVKLTDLILDGRFAMKYPHALS